MLGHGGTAGLALELAIVLVPLVLIVALLLWGRRHSGPGGAGGRGADRGDEPGGP